MIAKPSIVLDPRDARQILADILARRAGFTPEWLARPKSAGAGLASIAAGYLETVAQRLNQAPDKNKLAFLDSAGLGLIPAQAARAAVVFQVAAQSPGGSAPAGTALAAPPPPGGTQQITFETERATGITAGKIKQVFSLWPGRDEYIDHSAAFLKGDPVQTFSRLLRQPTPHHLYLSHSVLLALAGNVELNVEFELTHPSSAPLDILWEYWDGKVWRGFLSTTKECGAQTAIDLDSTNGLTESGRYILQADCAQASKTKVNNLDAYWLRGRLTQALLPGGGATTGGDCSCTCTNEAGGTAQDLPEVDSVRISSTVNQALRGRLRTSEPRAANVVGIQETGAATSVSTAANAITGQVFNEAGQAVAGAIVHLLDPANPTRFAFTSQPTDTEGNYSVTSVTFGVEYRYQVDFAGIAFYGPDDEVRPREAASLAKPVLDLMLHVDGLKPDKAFADSTSLDVSKPFYPVGQQPQPGASLYFTSEEAFTKPGAGVRAYLARTRSPQDEGNISTNSSELPHLVVWEYWNSRQWAPLAVTSSVADSKLDLNITEVLDFKVPVDMALLTLNGVEARWVRVRLQSGTYGFRHEITFKTGDADTNFTYVIVQPPVLAALLLGYTWQYGPFGPETVLTYNDFHYQDHTDDSAWPGTSFLPFERSADITPAVYLGFDKQPPVDQLGVFFDVVEDQAEPDGPALVWEYWTGFEWHSLNAEDETGNLRRPGIVYLLTEPDDTALDRFGTPLNWVRARLKSDGPPGEPTFAGVYPNAAWASERRTIRDLPVGTSNGTPNQVFRISPVPILDGESIEIRELSGARANAEWRIVATEIFQGDQAAIQDLEDQLALEGSNTDVVRSALRLVRDRKKRVVEAWVHWTSRTQLFFSGPDDRDYAIDRATGLLYFGDSVNGRVPPSGSAILIRVMRSGGGSTGNVAARTIKQLLGVVPGIEAVFNPDAAEGGADGETGDAALDRAPRTLRHRGRAIEAADYETLSREASPAVAFARAIPGRTPAGLTLPGWITVLVAPHSQDERPYPSFGLREQIRKYLEDRAPADIAALHRIHVTGPTYLPVNVDATVAPIDPSQAGAVEKAARSALERFLHPLLGGPSGEGWDLGRDVFLSDIAAELERTEGVDHVEELTLLRGSEPQGESLTVADDELVAAGTITLRLTEPEK